MGGSWSLLTIHCSFDHGGRESHRDRPVRLVRMSARAPPFSLSGGLCLRYGLGRRRHSYSHASCRHLLVRVLPAAPCAMAVVHQTRFGLITRTSKRSG